MHKEIPMTVCIAAIAEITSESPKIVFASDRLVSAGVCFESGVPKIKMLTNYSCVMLSSNDALTSDYIVTQAQKKIDEALKLGEKPTIEEIVGWISEACKNKLKSEKEKVVLSKRYDLTYDELKGKSKDLHERIIQDIITETDNFEYYFISQFLVVGIDSKPHIYVVDQEGNFQLCDLVGFATVGEGNYLAYPEITKFSYNPDVSLSEAIVRVYNAKKVAERVSGVGKETDLATLWVTSEKEVALWEADKDLKKILDDEMEEMRKQEIEAYSKVMLKVSEIFTGKSKIDNK